MSFLKASTGVGLLSTPPCGVLRRPIQFEIGVRDRFVLKYFNTLQACSFHVPQQLTERALYETRSDKLKHAARFFSACRITRAPCLEPLSLGRPCLCDTSGVKYIPAPEPVFLRIVAFGGLSTNRVVVFRFGRFEFRGFPSLIALLFDPLSKLATGSCSSCNDSIRGFSYQAVRPYSAPSERRPVSCCVPSTDC